MHNNSGAFVHLFNGKRKIQWAGQEASPKVLGVRLADFLRSLSDAQVAQMSKRLNAIEWVEAYDAMPTNLEDLYSAFGFITRGSWHHRPEEHQWYGLFHAADCCATEPLPHMLDESLTHTVDETTQVEKHEIEYKWNYRLDWDTAKLHVYGPMPGKMTVPFSKVDEQWMASCQAANDAWE